MAKREFKKTVLKILIWAAVLFAVYYFYSPLKFHALRILQLNPAVWQVYLSITHEIISSTLFGLFLTAFFGALFFVSIPVELVFLFYLSLRFTGWEVLVYVVLGNLLGMMFNYSVGYILGPKLMKKWLKEKYEKWQKRTEKSGALVLVIGNIVPFPIEIITLFIGGVRYSFSKFLLFTFIGKVVKFIILLVAFTYFSESVTGFWTSSAWPWLLSQYNSYLHPLLGLF